MSTGSQSGRAIALSVVSMARAIELFPSDLSQKNRFPIAKA